jgi:alanine racemase
MGRLGVAPEETAGLIGKLAALPGIKVCGLYTHYAASEDDAAFSRRQRNQFAKVVAQLLRAGRKFEYLHANNSGALLFERQSLYNTVRPGLLVYGVLPPGKRRAAGALKNHLRPALAWKCRVSLVKEIPRGTPLSYGRTFVAPRTMRVATLTAGYGDGYLRAGSNRAQVLIGGKRCPVVGRITMDQMLVDVSAVAGVGAGEEVVLIGRQGGQQITANDLAAWSSTVPWEVLTSINHRVPRVYLGGHAA